MLTAQFSDKAPPAAPRAVGPPLDHATPNNFGGVGLGEQVRGEVVLVFPVDGLKLLRCDFPKVKVEEMEAEVLEARPAAWRSTAYLEVAVRRSARLVTPDQKFRAAALAARGVKLVAA